VAFAAVALVATAAARWIDPLTAIGDIKSDEATYVSMALSVAHDGDLSFEKADLDRFLAIYPHGPEGIFLKRAYAVRPVVEARWPFLSLASTPIPTTIRLAYGKAFIYPVMAAPFVALGGVGGMLVFNLVLLAISLACAVRFCQAQCGRLAGAILGTAFIGASIVPVYGVFLMPEIFNFTLVFGAYFLWLYKEVAPPTAWLGWRRPATDLAAGVLLGLATYSKPSHVVLVGPLVLVALLAKRWRHATAIALVAGAAAGGLFAAHLFVTGEASYQGAATADGRKEFYDAFPFDAKGTTYDAYAFESVTNDTGSVNTTTTDVYVRLLPRNLWYYFVGRDAGLIPFFFPGVAILAFWLVRWRRARIWQVATMLAWAASILVFLVITPYTWNGGGGASGNRYFLSAYPTMLFLVPSATGLLASIVATAVGIAFTGTMVASPVKEAREPWLGVEGLPFRWLPVELTLVTNLPVDLLQGVRAHIPFLQDPVVLFSYMDQNTYFAEGDGLWIAGHAVTDIIIRTEQPILKLTLNITAKYVPNDVTATLDGHTERASIAPGDHATLTFTPRPGVWAHASYGVVLHLTTTRGFVPAEVGELPGPGQQPDTRNLGVFIRPTFVVSERPPGG
jgi:4-amino-4-deoxy-L-arabinose transferase-like glycosyltransferase